MVTLILAVKRRKEELGLPQEATEAELRAAEAEEAQRGKDDLAAASLGQVRDGGHSGGGNREDAGGAGPGSARAADGGAVRRGGEGAGTEERWSNLDSLPHNTQVAIAEGLRARATMEGVAHEHIEGTRDGKSPKVEVSGRPLFRAS